MRPKSTHLAKKVSTAKKNVALPVYLSPGKEKKNANKQLETDT